MSESLPPLQIVNSRKARDVLNDVPVSGGPDLAPHAPCKYLLPNKSTAFLKFMFKTRTAKHKVLKPETRLRAGLESREKEIGSQCEHLLGATEEGGGLCSGKNGGRGSVMAQLRKLKSHC